MNVFTVSIEGYLTAEDFADKLRTIGRQMASLPGSHGLMFDIVRMTGYEPRVRDTYVDWYRGARQRIGRVAVVTDKSMWRIVVATLGLATGGTTRAFAEPEIARDWLTG